MKNRNKPNNALYYSPKQCDGRYVVAVMVQCRLFAGHSVALRLPQTILDREQHE